VLPIPDAIVGDWNGSEAAPMPIEITDQVLPQFVNEAIVRWTKAATDAGSTPTRVDRVVKLMKTVTFNVADLSAGTLDLLRRQVQVKVLPRLGSKSIGMRKDRLFIDPTPNTDEEFTAVQGQVNTMQAVDARAMDRVDLLSVVEHELGHVLGLGDLGSSADDLMSANRSAGIRVKPGAQGHCQRVWGSSRGKGPQT